MLKRIALIALSTLLLALLIAPALADGYYCWDQWISGHWAYYAGHWYWIGGHWHEFCSV